MCGRYYVDDETAREIEKLVRELDRKLQIERTGDIRPSQRVAVIRGENKHLMAVFLASNFPHFHRYDSLKSALYIHAVSKNINTFPKNQGRIRAAIAVEILDFTVMYR